MKPIKLELSAPPVIGITSWGQEIRLGGFSGLRFLGCSPTGLYRFVTHTDRGPNGEERVVGEKQIRPFGLPDFQPSLVFLEADTKASKLYVSKILPLRLKNGQPVQGLPSEENSEVAVDFQGKSLGAKEDGLDLEGIALASDGTYWMAEEYGPSLVQFSSDGILLQSFGPGRGLPEYFKQRRLNRGFEGIAVFGSHIFAALESPLDNPPSPGQKNSRRSRITRIVEFDPFRKITVAQYAYVLDEPDSGRISDIMMDGPEQMLVIEKGETAGKEWKRIYRVDLGGATNLQRLSSVISGPNGTLELSSEQELARNGVVPVHKEIAVELGDLGMKEEKFEGLDRVNEGHVAVITDNDFGLAGPIDYASGIALEKKEEKTSYLYFLPVIQG